MLKVCVCVCVRILKWLFFNTSWSLNTCIYSNVNQYYIYIYIYIYIYMCMGCLCICMEKLCQHRDRRSLKSLNSIEKIQHRIMVTTFDSNPNATMISCYSPTNVSEETNLIAFYNKLSSLVCSIPKHNVFVIGGDMNAQIGKKVNHKFSLHNSSNRNTEHLTDFTRENRLSCPSILNFRQERKNYGSTPK